MKRANASIAAFILVVLCGCSFFSGIRDTTTITISKMVFSPDHKWLAIYLKIYNGNSIPLGIASASSRLYVNGNIIAAHYDTYHAKNFSQGGNNSAGDILVAGASFIETKNQREYVMNIDMSNVKPLLPGDKMDALVDIITMEGNKYESIRTPIK